eukprot:86460_1
MSTLIYALYVFAFAIIIHSNSLNNHQNATINFGIHIINQIKQQLIIRQQEHTNNDNICDFLRYTCQDIITLEFASLSNDNTIKQFTGYCLKLSLEFLLNPKHYNIYLIQPLITHPVPSEFYFLCSGEIIILQATDTNNIINNSKVHQNQHLLLRYRTTKVNKLTTLARKIYNMTQTELTEKDNIELQEMILEYKNLSSVENMNDWIIEEKIDHYLEILKYYPDNLHLIDRIAVTLSINNIHKYIQAKTLLLHYSVLRQIIKHPLQRPLEKVLHNLRSTPYWYPYHLVEPKYNVNNENNNK